VWRATLEGLLEADGVEDAARIAAPTLILWGDRDAFVPRADQQLLERAIRNSRLVVYPGAGHSPHWEAPEQFVTDLLEFVRRLPAQARC
jgi:pimeloyl-ACP methyl ester carboxylesterase